MSAGLSASLKDIVDAEGGVSRGLSLAGDTARKLRGMILLEKLPPGMALPERDLAAALGISRTPLREAIRTLANEGLVQYSAARRPFVADPSLEEINDCLRVQGVLEALAGELACQNASNADMRHIAQLNAAIADVAEGADRLEAFRTDMRFHEAIVAAAGNAALAETHGQYNARLWRARFLSSQRRASRDSTRFEHSQIVAALSARNGLSTARALKNHLKTAEMNIALALTERTAQQAI